jgi:integrase/recombinase XerD
MNELTIIDQHAFFSTDYIMSGESAAQLVPTLMNSQYYLLLRERISAFEDEDGNYDYSGISNLGMVYLYVHNREKKRKDKTKEDYVRTLTTFLVEVSESGKGDLRELSRFDMELFQAGLEQRYSKSNTQAKKIVIIHSFLTWCYEEGYLAKNIARGLRQVAKIKEEIPERDIEEADLRLAIEFHKENPKVQSLLLILATSGMRLNEVILPRWGDLYYDRNRKRHYLITRTKGDKLRHVHIKDYALEVLMEYRRRVGLPVAISSGDDSPFYPNRHGKRYNLTSLSTFLSEQMAAAGLTTVHGHRVTPHFMRHYFAQTSYANGAPLDWISETVGHSSTKITKDNYLSRQLKKERDVSDYVDLS